jgi:hypothetical protein
MDDSPDAVRCPVSRQVFQNLIAPGFGDKTVYIRRLKVASAMKRLFRWLKRITGISTPLGGISWNAQQAPYDVATFNGTILLTSDGNDEFISFLEANTRRIVYLKATIDACVATEKQMEFVETRHIDLDAITSGTLNGQTFTLQYGPGGIVYLEFDLLANHKPKPSYGGTGIIMLFLNGFFEIIGTAHSGPSTVFHLKEIEAPLDARLTQLNRAI